MAEEYLHYECGLPWNQHEWTFPDGEKPRRVCPDEAPPSPLRPRLAEPRVFEARYPGRCPRGDRIKPGDLVRYVDDELQHVTCDGAETEPPIGDLEPERDPCPRCFVVPSVSGACLC